MSNPRQYGKAGLFPGLRKRSESRHPVAHAIKEWGHPSGYNEGSCCLQCRRLLDKIQTAAREDPLAMRTRPGPPSARGKSPGKRILPAECCNDCGRWPIDQALIDKGHLGVQSDPRWAVERMKIADLRTTFAPGDKIIPSQREVANA